MLYTIQTKSAISYKLIELLHWTGKMIIVPRDQLNKFISDEPELSNLPGVYFLLGENDNGEELLYIGKAERVGNRLNNHNLNKSWWNKVIFFTQKLDSADITHLEHLLILKAKEINRIKLENIANPQKNIVDSFKQEYINDYLDKIITLLKLNEYFFLEEVTRQENKVYSLIGEGYSAQAIYLGNGAMRILVGSKFRTRETLSLALTIHNKRIELLNNKTLQHHEDVYEVVKEFETSSPSLASDLVIGRSSNGWTSWKNKEGKTLDENER